MKLPSIPFDIADGNSQMNLVNFTASLKEAIAQIRDLGEDFSEDGFWIPGWHKLLMAPCSQLRVSQLPCPGDEDEADGSGRLRQSRS